MRTLPSRMAENRLMKSHPQLHRSWDLRILSWKRLMKNNRAKILKQFTAKSTSQLPSTQQLTRAKRLPVKLGPPQCKLFPIKQTSMWVYHPDNQTWKKRQSNKTSTTWSDKRIQSTESQTICWTKLHRLTKNPNNPKNILKMFHSHLKSKWWKKIRWNCRYNNSKRHLKTSQSMSLHWSPR